MMHGRWSGQYMFYLSARPSARFVSRSPLRFNYPAGSFHRPRGSRQNFAADGEQAAERTGRQQGKRRWFGGLGHGKLERVAAEGGITTVKGGQSDRVARHRRWPRERGRGVNAGEAKIKGTARRDGGGR